MTSRSEIITLFLVSIIMFFIMGNNLGPTLRSETVTLVMNMLETFLCTSLCCFVVQGKILASDQHEDQEAPQVNESLPF